MGLRKQEGRFPRHYTHYMHGKKCKAYPVGVVRKHWNSKHKTFPGWIVSEIRAGRLVMNDRREVGFNGSFGYMEVDHTEWLIRTDNRVVIVETNEAFRSEYYPVW